MNFFICFSLWMALWCSCNYAEKFRLKRCIEVQEHKYPAFSFEPPKIQGLTVFACPASTEREMKFNDEVSITRKSIFLRDIHKNGENTTLHFCDKTPEPGMVYNVENNKFEIGYEFYYEKDKIHYLRNEIYSNYRSVNIKNEVINQSKILNHFVQMVEDVNNTQFTFNNESSTLIFHWVPSLSITCSNYNKQTKLPEKDLSIDDINYKCEDFDELNETSMELYLSSVEPVADPAVTISHDTENVQLWQEHGYGDLKMSQIVPLWYKHFETRWSKLASCTHMNMVPVWKTIANGQLRKVDLYVQAVVRHLSSLEGWSIDRVIFGTNDILKTHNKTNNPNERKQIYASDTKHSRLNLIPVPKIIYRVIQAEYSYGSRHDAVIVIHNDPIDVRDDDRICKNETEIPHWDTIRNENHTIGLTYVCVLNEEISTILGIHTVRGEEPLDLDSIPYSPNPGYTYPIEDTSQTYNIDSEFDALLSHLKENNGSRISI